MPLSNFPDFEFGKWGNIADLNPNDTTKDYREKSNSPTIHPAEFSEPEPLDKESNRLRLIAEELHPHDQEALLERFPFIAMEQHRIAAREFCQFQKIRASQLY
ncbi:MAG: hypothetical protein INR81_11270 [Microcystis aeruginosa PMC 728.11]|jgi:hypothetical protein|nr:hypothetical protein [Microcystis aeruginosa PMC 728.11]NCS30267.1 hypothetical protein [Microcystis aeruginosa F13-15]